MSAEAQVVKEKTNGRGNGTFTHVMRDRCFAFCTGAVCILSVVCCALIAVIALYYTGMVRGFDSEFLEFFTFKTPQTWVLWLAGMAVAAVMVVFLVFIYGHIGKIQPRKFFMVLFLFTFVVSLIWIVCLRADYNLFPDARNLISYANGIVLDEPRLFEDGAEVEYPLEWIVSYFRHYPFQAGYLWYVVAMFRMFGSGNLLALQIVNVFANEVAFACVYVLGGLLFSDRATRNVLALLFALFVPFWLLAAFPYGNSLGFSLGLLFLTLQVKSMVARENRARLVLSAVSFAPLVLSLMVKSTFIIFALVAVVAALLKSLRDGRFVYPAIVLCMLLCANSLANLPVRALEKYLDVDLGRGMPKLSWIVLGMTEDETYGQPGLWDFEAYEIYGAAEGDYEQQEDIAIKRLEEIFLDMGSDPGYALRFIITKLAVEWADPLYLSMHYAFDNVSAETLAGDQLQAQVDIYMGVRVVATVVYDAYQLIIYALALVGTGAFLRLGADVGARDSDSYMGLLTLEICFLAGFACYFFWEAKSVYLLPYATTLLPVAAFGLRSTMTSFHAARSGS